MKDLLIEANRTNKTPLVDFKTSGELCIEGRSIPENATAFYSPIIQWIRHWEAPLPPKITLTIRLEYFNTSSSNIILNIIKLFEEVQARGGTQVCIVWQYHIEDEDMHEAGVCYQSISRVSFELSPCASANLSISNN